MKGTTAMGMSASQARFLSLTARKNNVEIQGQQINQQRTTLSNESSSYYSELCNMTVPTPPSVDDYTKVSYSFNDGALTNTVTSMIVNPTSKNKGLYSISYIQQWQDDYSIVSASSSLISKSVGSVKTLAELTEAEQSKLEYYRFSEDLKSAEKATKGSDGKFYINNEEVDENDLVCCLYDSTKTNAADAVSLVTKTNDGKYVKETTTDETEYKIGTSTLRKLGTIGGYTSEMIKNMSESEFSMFKNSTSAITSDSYLSSLDQSQLKDFLEQEVYYKSMLNDYNSNNPGSTQDWYVRYIKNSTSGTYTPYFYKASEVEDADKYNSDNYATSTINCYSIGSTTKTKEVLNQTGRVEKDSSGRYISITIYQTDDEGNIKYDENKNEMSTTYTLTTNTSTDEDAYNDAMNKYKYEQNQYDQKIQEINSKLEIIQQQDKSLELNLKQLDTEENAISTEMEAVKKVISKNVESSFKTFNA